MFYQHLVPFNTMDWRNYKTSLQSDAMVANVLALSLELYSLFFYVSSPSLADLSYSSYANLSSYFSAPFAAMHLAKTLRRFATAVLSSNMASYVRKGGRSTVFSATQYLCFFNLVMSPTASQRITLVIGIQILTPTLPSPIPPTRFGSQLPR